LVKSAPLPPRLPAEAAWIGGSQTKLAMLLNGFNAVNCPVLPRYVDI
jgi:hypothetical protein